MRGNIFNISETPQTGELTEDILHYKNVRIKRIVSSDKLERDTFCQQEAEWVCLLEGSAEIAMDRQTYHLQKGDFLFIPPLHEHTVTSVTKGTVWLAIHIYEEGA